MIQPVKKKNKLVSSKAWYEADDEGRKWLHGSFEIEAIVPDIGVRDICSISSDGTVWAWFFNEIENFIPGDSGNVLKLCEDYYVGLKWLVEEWIRERARQGRWN